jgi:hypothetical protein
MPFSSVVLNFAYAELLETKKEFSDIHLIYGEFLAALRANLETSRTKPTPQILRCQASPPPPQTPIQRRLALPRLEVNYNGSSREFILRHSGL